MKVEITIIIYHIMYSFLSKIKTNDLRTNLTYVGTALLTLYALCWLYVSYYWKEYQEEFESYHIYDISMILFYRALMNMSFGTLVVPMAFIFNSLEGIVHSVNIVYIEVLNIPNILRRIFNSWFIRLLWDNIEYYMMLFGRWAEPWFTLIVRMGIHLGLFVMFGGMVLSVIYLFSSLKRSMVNRERD